MAERLRVLIVEDNVLDAELLVRELKRHGYAPVSARVETLEDLCAALAAESWDLVITDNSMPRCSGAMVLEQMRSIEPALPVIIVSGGYSKEMAHTLIDAGAQDVLPKGDSPALLDALGRALAARGAGQAAP
jgi:CheY-like chemotaxis protein